MNAGKEGYELVKGERKRVQDRLAALGAVRPAGAIKAEIAAQHQNKLWSQSDECKEATTTASRAFCAATDRLAGELASAEEAERLHSEDDKLAAKMEGMDLSTVLRSADAQSEALSRLTGLSAATVKDSLAILVALLIELGSGLGLWVTTGGSERVGDMRQNASAVPEKQPEPATVTKMKVKDPVKLFTRAAIVERTNGEVTAAALYDAYAAWAEREGQEELSPTAFGRRMSALGYERTKRGGKVLYIGVALVARPSGVAQRG